MGKMVDLTEASLAQETHSRAGARLKVAIVHPTTWPEVRRGTERFMNELGSYLARRGHHAKIISSRPGSREIRTENGFAIDQHRAVWSPWMARFGVHPFHVFPVTTLTALLHERFDVVHCFNFTDACAAAAARRFTGARILLHLASIPPPSGYRRSVSTGGALFRYATRVSDAVLTNGDFQAGYFEKRLGRRPMVIKAPVDTDRFRPNYAGRPDTPVLLNASALDERRKGGRFLMRVFDCLKRQLPTAELHICSAVGDSLKQSLLGEMSPEWRRDVIFDRPDEQGLAAAYASASVLVLPSLWEAFPLVILESLASGTPVVGTRNGGISELISSGAVGRTFDPGPLDSAEPTNIEGMVEAILAALQLSRLPETASRCREAAERFGWNVLGRQYEAVYYDLCRPGSDRSKGLHE